MRRRRAAHAAILLLAPPASLAILASAPDVHAQASAEVPILALEWSAPPECPDTAHVKARVEQLVGRSRGDKTLTADGRMTASSATPRYRLELVVGGASPRRTMAGADCARLAEAAALILALDIDPEALSRTNTESTTRTGTGSAPRVEPPKAPLPSPREEARPNEKARPSEQKAATIELDLGARLLFDYGSLPRSTLGLGAVGAVAYGGFSLGIAGSLYERQFIGGPRGGSGGAYVDLATVGIQGCGRRRVATIGVRACLGGELGREGTRGVGISEPGASAALWGAAMLALDARAWDARPFSPTAGVAVGHPFTAPDVVIQGFGTVFEPPLVFVRAHLGLEVRFF